LIHIHLNDLYPKNNFAKRGPHIVQKTGFVCYFSTSKTTFITLYQAVPSSPHTQFW